MNTYVVLSGAGIKSAVAAGRYAREHEIHLVHVDYGQPAASAQARSLALLAAYWPSAKVWSLTLPPLKQVHSAARAGTAIGNAAGRQQSDDAVQKASRRTLLPGLLSAGAQAAARFEAESIVVGCSALTSGDHLGLPGANAGPDALREALHAFDIMLETILRPRSRVRIEAPLMDLSYAQIVKLGQRFKIPWERTHTCEAPSGITCGQCTLCKARAEAFLEAAIQDPIAPALKAAPAPVGAAS